MEKHESGDSIALKNYYSGMADAVRYIENGVAAGLEYREILDDLRNKVTSRREQYQRWAV